MHLIALYSLDREVVAALERHRDARYHLHSLDPQTPSARVFAALAPLEFAGALVLGTALQEQALAQMARSSLEAREIGLVDTVTVTPAGLVGDYLLGRALGQALRAESWDPRHARAVVLGSGPEARVIARELASAGVGHLSILAGDRPSAERSLPAVPRSTETTARALLEPTAPLLIESADLIVRADPSLQLDPALLGPHLSVVDLAPEPLSELRRAALAVGAKTIGLRDLQAFELSTALGHILGGALEVETFLGLLHGGTR